jgi:predicted metal-dependent HD superfamily phosphohydrolase
LSLYAGISGTKDLPENVEQPIKTTIKASGIDQDGMELIYLIMQSTAMLDINNSILAAASKHVSDIFSNKVSKDFIFHSYQHTSEVVLHSELIAGTFNISDDDRLALILAAWFHDTGYSSGMAKYHETESQRIATEFLQDHHVSEEIIAKVNNCIIATRMPQSPTNTIEQILCDADLFHLGSSEFYDKNKLLREEINRLKNDKISKKDWRKINIEFLKRHRYFTDYAHENLDPVKKKHLNELLEKEGLITEPVKGKEETKSARNDRGVVAMFRIMSDSHVSLSQMADSKANIMISVNTIVISIMVSVLLGKLQFYPEFIIPTIILVSVCLAAVIFAILATRPNISGGTFAREDIENKKVNLLFFGNFYNMQLSEYDWAMKEMMQDKEYLYGSMIKDMYYLGLVLARKYRFLRVSYNIFMYGLIAAIIAFALAFIFGAG